MKKALAWLLVIAMTAALAVGGTLAYLTDTDDDVNVMTVGQVKIDQLEYERVNVDSKDEDATVQEFHDNKPLYPAVIEDGFNWEQKGTVNWDQIGKDGYTSTIWDPTKINNEQDKMVFVKNKGDWDAYVRTVFAFEAGSYTDLDAYLADIHLNLNETDWTWEWVETPMTIGEGKYFVATATYNKALEPGKLTEISLSQIAMDPTVTNEDILDFGDTFQVLVQSQAVQADGFADPDTALNEAFGKIPPAPFEDDLPTDGIDLKTALHYYEGDGSKITTKVSNVYFGVNGQYSDKIDGLDGTLVDIEQDVPVYAYYVPNSGNYDVYFVASDEIYLPKRASNLFTGMTALKTVTCDNLDTSRTTNMYEMFYNCTSLTTVDTADWDVSKVTNMCAMFDTCGTLTTLDTTNWNPGSVKRMEWLFNGCSKLQTVDVSNWDVSNVTNLSCAFRNCSALTGLNVSNWNVGNVTSFNNTFYGCTKLNGLDVSEWDVSKVQDMKNMFYNCTSLTALDVSDWNPCNVTTMAQMFLFCSALTEMDMANWDVSKVTSFHGMFGFASNLQTVKVDNWQPSSATSFCSMFHDCTKLLGFDASDWKMPNLSTTSHMFRGCNSATSIDVSGWYTPSLTSMDGMFHTCKSLTEVDLSSFDTSKCLEMSQIFDHATGIQTVKGMDKLNTSSAKTFEEAFAGCTNLKVVDLSSFNTRNVVNAYYPMQNGATGYGFKNMFPATCNWEKLIIGADVSFDGDGKVTTDSHKIILPSPTAKAGFIAKWQNVDTGVTYLASEIPEETAATYVPYYEPITNP